MAIGCYDLGGRSYYVMNTMKKDVLTSAFLGIRNNLHRIAMKLLQNDEEAKDALQDTFLRLWSKGEIETDNEARYKLIHILHNTCIDRLRSRHTISLEQVAKEIDNGYETPIEDLAKYEQLIISGLTEIQRQIYVMITKECMEYEEISRQLGVTVDSVRMNMSRARKRIRENIKLIDR